MNRRSFLSLATVGIVAGAAFVGYSFWPGQSLAEGEIVFTGETPGVAINGYDSVAYFPQGKPVKGIEDFSVSWNGVSWHFASADNRAAFEADPKKYAPQYGGYCAYAVANGSTAKTEPDAFNVVDGKLYLNYDQSVRSLWEREKLSYIKSADQNWPGLSKSQ